MANSIQAPGAAVPVRATPEPTRRTDERGSSATRPAADPQAVLASIEAFGGSIRFGHRSAEFSYDADLNRVVVKVFSSDNEPREIVRQIPPEDYLTFSARYRELLGLLFDEQV